MVGVINTVVCTKIITSHFIYHGTCVKEEENAIGAWIWPTPILLPPVMYVKQLLLYRQVVLLISAHLVEPFGSII